MRVFVGFGYNDRDKWIEDYVFPLLVCLGFSVEHGKDLHGQILQPAVGERIQRSDIVVGFFTERVGEPLAASFRSHVWVRDELTFALGKNKPIIAIKELGVAVPDGLLGNRQYIELRSDDRLACAVELVKALGRKNIRRLRLEPVDDALRRSLLRWRNDQTFAIRYRTRDESGLESGYLDGRLELVDQGFYLNVSEVPRRCLIEVDGLLGGQIQMGSGWVSADAVQVQVF